MRLIRILSGPVTFPARALFTLTKDQWRRRKRLLKNLGDGKFLGLERVQFKTGETLKTDAEIPKGWADKVEVIEPEKPKPEPVAEDKPVPAKKATTRSKAKK